MSVTVYPGKNVIRRPSTNSTVTLSSRNLFAPSMTLSTDDHCKCGWPDYLLIPKGTHWGTKFQLFVVVTNFAEDKVIDNHLLLKSMAFILTKNIVFERRCGA